MNSERERITVVRSDITQLSVDAIVNAANDRLARGAGVCGAIFAAAGPELDTACAAVAPCSPGEARITSGFNSKARWIVHAVGPIWQGGRSGEPALLASAYRSSLKLARNADARSIAFPAISTGIYGYPLESAAKIAIETTLEWCEDESSPERIVFCCFSDADSDVYKRLLT